MSPIVMIILRLRTWKHQALLAWQDIFCSLLIFLENNGIPVRSILPVRGALSSTLDYIDSNIGFAFGSSFQILPIEHAEISRTMPVTINSEIHPSFLKARIVQQSQLFLAYLPGSYIVSNDGVVLTPHKQLLNDISYEMGRSMLNHSFLTRLSLPSVEKISGRAFVLTTHSCNNLYHWMFDVLPKLALLEAFGENPDLYCTVTTQTFQQDSLELLGIDSKKIYQLCPSTNLLPDVVLAASPPGRNGEVSGFTCAYLRERLAGKLLNVGVVRHKVVIIRDLPGRRSWINFEESKTMLAQLGFIFLKLEEYSLSEKIKLFASSEIVLAPHGAGLSNIVFCPRETQIIELFSPMYVNPCYWKLASSCGLRYSYLIGVDPRVAASASTNQFSADISISKAQLESLFEHLGIS